MARPFVTLVVCSIDAPKYDGCVARYRQLFAPDELEVFGIHDAASLASAYNWAARRASGELVVFSHDDVEIVSPHLGPALRRAMVSLDLKGIPGKSRVVDAYWPRAGQPHLHGWMASPGPDGFTVNVYGVDGPVTSGLEGLDGMFFAAKPVVLDRIRFDEATFDGFHGYDLDFTLCAHRAGFRVGTCAEVAVIHASTGGFGADWARYAAKFAAKHHDFLSGRIGARTWPVAAIKVATKDDIARAFPLAKLETITSQLLAQSTGDGRSR
jgi:GT2 family glycosyltransferase